MKAERKFLIASSIVRLIERECLPTRSLVEGFFQPLPDRSHFVQFDTDDCSLVLRTFVNSQATEQRARIPASQADALLPVCAGKVVYRRTKIQLEQGVEALLDRFAHPSGVEVLVLEFDDEERANAFCPPEWFGEEVTDEPTYTKQSLALTGAPSQVDVEATNATVISLLETLDAIKRWQPALDEATIAAAPVIPADEDLEDVASALAEPAFRLPSATSRPVDVKARPDLLAGIAQALDQAWPANEQDSQERHAIPLRRSLAR